MTVGVIVTHHDTRRADTIGSILSAWRSEEPDHLWLVNASGKPMTNGGGWHVFNLPFDTGNGTDYALATLMDADAVVLADDDFLPRTGFLSIWKSDGWLDRVATSDTIVGVIGRRLYGPIYKKQSDYFRADTVRANTRVGFCGVCVAAGRSAFGFDCRGMTRNIDDLWWQLLKRPKHVKYVAPNPLYEDLPCASDDSAMYRSGELRGERRDFYAKHWMRSSGL